MDIENNSVNLPNNTFVFFGSGPVAAASLAYLADNFAIETVITKRRPAHHKDPAPVEELAKAKNIPLTFADTKAELELVIDEQKPSSNCGIVIDYGVIISQQVIDYFTHGIVNSHFSILPEWRGADPITFALLSGQKQTGVSLMRIDAGLDTGDIIAESFVPISPNETNASLTEKLIETSNVLLSATLGAYVAGEIVAVPQDTQTRITTYSRKLTKQDGWINITKPARVIEREIRAYQDWPKSKITLGPITVIIVQARLSDEPLACGDIRITDNKQLLMGTRVGTLSIVELMPLGKQKMSATAFLNGYGVRIPAHL